LRFRIRSESLGHLSIRVKKENEGRMGRIKLILKGRLIIVGKEDFGFLERKIVMVVVTE
jgi:hypothetical protein